jgi:hypothetical protein
MVILIILTLVLVDFTRRIIGTDDVVSRDLSGSGYFSDTIAKKSPGIYIYRKW